ncbi:MAG: hypothetical protein RLY31_1263 [Bacteroidota bacterium]
MRLSSEFPCSGPLSTPLLRFHLTLLVLLVLTGPGAFRSAAQESQVKKVVLQGFWWDYWNNHYPYGWANYLTDLAPRLRSMGVDAVWIPPSVKNNGRVVGYAPFDHYDLGDKFQKGSDSTRLGTKDELLRMVAVLHANGIEVIQDIVPNHVIGAGSDNGSGGQDPAAPTVPCTDTWKNFRYASYASPATDQSETDYLSRTGRFPKNHPNFHPNLAHSCSVGLCNASADAWCWQAFGPDVCYYDDAYGNSSNATYNPDQSAYAPYGNGGIGPNNGYMRKHTREWLVWYKKQLGFDGVRIDAVKHFPPFVSEDFLYNMQQQAQWANGGNEMFAVGEWVGGTSELDAWSAAVQGRSGTFDFNLRAFDANGGIYGMIHGNGGYDMGNLPGAQQGFRYVDSNNVRIHRTVPFVNNHDTYRPATDSLGNINGWNNSQELSPHVDIREPRLGAAYAAICAMDGNPQIFFEDLFNIANTGRRWTHRPTDSTELPVHQDLANIMRCHGALRFKAGDYRVPSNLPSLWNNVTASNNNDDILVIERSGRAIIGITDSWTTDQDVWVDTDFPIGTVLRDHSGGFSTTTTVLGPSGGGTANRVNIKVRAVGYPSFSYSGQYADHGAHYHGYAIWGPDSVQILQHANPPIPTTQEWEMEDDLGDSHCASLGQGGRTPDHSTNSRVVGKIFPAAGSTVSYSLFPGSPGEALLLSFHNRQGESLHADTLLLDSLTGSFVPAETGWVTMKIRNLTDDTPGQKCWLKMTYSAPAQLPSALPPARNLLPVWTSNGGSSDWTDCRNWEEGLMPGCQDSVWIPHPTDFLPLPDSCFTGTFLPGFCAPPTTDSITVVHPACLLPATGSVTVQASSALFDLEYSVDSGLTWQADPHFGQLAAGTYHVAVRLAARPDCWSLHPGNPIQLVLPTGCCLLPGYDLACTDGHFIDGFSLAGYQQQESGCSANTQNHTAYPDGPAVQLGETYPLLIRSGNQGLHVALYMDLDRNGSFRDAGEFFNLGYVPGNDTASFLLTIPGQLDTGTYAIRLRSSNQTLTAADGCQTVLPSGETEDYQLKIFCAQTLTLSAATIDSGVYAANGEILAQGSIGPDAVVEFRMGSVATLMESFEIQPGGVLTITPASCFP